MQKASGRERAQRGVLHRPPRHTHIGIQALAPGVSCRYVNARSLARLCNSPKGNKNRRNDPRLIRGRRRDMGNSGKVAAAAAAAANCFLRLSSPQLYDLKIVHRRFRDV